jgi:hypothetical protein
LIISNSSWDLKTSLTKAYSVPPKDTEIKTKLLLLSDKSNPRAEISFQISSFSSKDIPLNSTEIGQLSWHIGFVLSMTIESFFK